MADGKGTADGWPSLVIHFYRAIKNTCSLASWNSLPWILGMYKNVKFLKVKV